ncbi:MAG TPA: nucleoside 2-deoxyribosyltransferase [Methanophagales archaeon]|nr:nucleoside 2-deoxyribosyltransferase [Methanophagales archaeon]
MKKITNVYIAGPLFNWGEQWFNVRLKEELEKVSEQRKLGITFHLPQELEVDNASDIFVENKKRLNKSQCLVAILDGADIDSGTSWEIGYAHAKDKKIIGVRTDFRYSGEQGKGNLMILKSLSSQLINKSRFKNKPRFYSTSNKSEKTQGDFISKLAASIIRKILKIETQQK